MTITTITEAADALFRAADWLDANPEGHIVGDMAMNRYGKPVPPTDTSATCFCALGRIAKEADLVGYDATGVGPYHSPYEEVTNFLDKWFGHTEGQGSDLVRRIYRENDDKDDRTGADVTGLLRTIANKVV